ncbi:hypothetical protein ACRBEV_05650 [Methylobacterium phyllosphaerae]
MSETPTKDRVGVLGNLTSFVAPRLPNDAANWFLLLFSGGTVLSAVMQRHFLEEAQTAQHLIEFNVGEAFGLAAIISAVLARSHRCVTLARTDITVLLLSALAWFVPEQHCVYLATTFAGGWVLLRRKCAWRLADVGQVWIVLSIHELWGKLLFKLTYQLIEVIEVGLIYKIGLLIYSHIEIDGTSLSIRDDWSIVVVEGCSSFHNLSLAVLIWLSILKIAEQSAGRAAFRALAVSACLVIAINVARILAMLPSREAYSFWHDGNGSSLVALGSVLAAVIPVLICVEDRACRPSTQS